MGIVWIGGDGLTPEVASRRQWAQRAAGLIGGLIGGRQPPLPGLTCRLRGGHPWCQQSAAAMGSGRVRTALGSAETDGERLAAALVEMSIKAGVRGGTLWLPMPYGEFGAATGKLYRCGHHWA